MLSEQEQIRREKLNKLKEMGIDPFPAALFPINTNSLEIISNYKENKKVSRNLKRQFLHASQVKFNHPITNKTLSLVTELPRDLKKTLEKIKTQ